MLDLIRDLTRDLRVGLRSLRQSPAFSLVVVTTIALGVGVNGAVFSVLSGTLIRPTPWRDPGSLVMVVDRNPAQQIRSGPLSLPRFRDLRDQSRALSDVAGARGQGFVLRDSEGAHSLRGVQVTPGMFELLGLELALGRPLLPSDAAPGAPCAVVLDHRVWVARYAADPSLLGREIELDLEPCRVVGVLAPQVWFPNPGTSVLAPLRDRGGEDARERRELIVVARLSPGVERSTVQAELDVLSGRLAGEFAESDEGWSLRGMEISELMFAGTARDALLVLAGAIACMMLVACANLTGLLLTRGAGRQAELAVRAAIGASRGRLVRQLMTENLLLVVAAIPLALGITRATLEVMYRQTPPQILAIDRIFRFDPSVWLFIGGAALVTVAVFGIVPALRATRVDLVGALKQGGDRGASAIGSQWLRSGLVVAQLAGSVVLLVGASLLSQSFLNVVSADTGIRTEGLLFTPIVLPDDRYPSDLERAEFARALCERLERLPSIGSVGVADSTTMAAGGPTRKLRVVGQSSRSGSETVEAKWTAVSPGMLTAQELRQVLGRRLEATDDARAPRVALVSRSFLPAWFEGDESPLGRTLEDTDGNRAEIVGVVDDVTQLGIAATQLPQVYVPFAQQPARVLGLVARPRGDPLAAGPAVRDAVEALDPRLPIYLITTVDQAREDAVWSLALFATILTLLGGVGLFMASIGIYGVVRYSTQQRTRELGIRSALGATPLELLRLVVRHAVWLVAGGLFVGLLLAVGLSRVLAFLLYEVDAFQPASFGLPLLLLAVAALTAAVLPALRAARTDPMLALRYE